MAILEGPYRRARLRPWHRFHRWLAWFFGAALLVLAAYSHGRVCQYDAQRAGGPSQGDGCRRGQ